MAPWTSLFIVLLSLVVNGQISSELSAHHDSLTSIAFVFAGSPRSFIYPIIHLSIKHNLIDGFCPKEMCRPHIFVRLSLSDNSHDGIRYSAKGRMLPYAASKRDIIYKALATLGPHVNSTVVDIGSEAEMSDMNTFISRVNNSMSHRIYRDLDPRRYSMYFNRMKAYYQALDYEATNSIRFSWIVHARLDFFFGERVRPFWLWSPRRLWVTDQWMYDVPDVLALLPRRYSDMFYSMETLFSDSKVPCLGGPDFDNDSVNVTALRNRSYTDAEIAFVERELCWNKFNEPGSVVIDRDTNHKWSTEGISEVVLRRKLKINGVSLMHKTLGYSTFFAVMVREPLSFVCANSKPSNFIGWLRMRYRANGALASGCFSLDDDLRFLRKQHKYIARDPDVAAGQVTTASESQKMPFGGSCSMDAVYSWPSTTNNGVDLTSNTPNSACLIDGNVTRWNFMPFRIRSPELCVTYTLTPGNLRGSLSLKPCNETSLFDDEIRIHYAVNQLFHFYPFTTRPQRITHFPYDRTTRFCLTVKTVADFGSSLQLGFFPCATEIKPYQLFVVDYKVDSAPQLTAGTTDTEENHGLVRIRYWDTNATAGEEMCVSTRMFGRRGRQGKVVLVPCQSSSYLRLERSVNKSPTQNVPDVSRRWADEQ